MAYGPLSGGHSLFGVARPCLSSCVAGDSRPVLTSSEPRPSRFLPVGRLLLGRVLFLVTVFGPLVCSLSSQCFSSLFVPARFLLSYAHCCTGWPWAPGWPSSHWIAGSLMGPISMFGSWLFSGGLFMEWSFSALFFFASRSLDGPVGLLAGFGVFPYPGLFWHFHLMGCQFLWSHDPVSCICQSC